MHSPSAFAGTYFGKSRFLKYCASSLINPSISRAGTSSPSLGLISSRKRQLTSSSTTLHSFAAVKALNSAASCRRLCGQTTNDGQDFRSENHEDQVSKADIHRQGDVDGAEFEVTGSLLEARRAGADAPSTGQFLELSHAFGPNAVAAFAAYAGDDNPIHLDDGYARRGG